MEGPLALLVIHHAYPALLQVYATPAKNQTALLRAQMEPIAYAMERLSGTAFMIGRVVWRDVRIVPEPAKRAA